MIKVNTPTFGPGGNSDAFKAAGKKSTVQAPEWIRSIGLDAYEFEAGRGVNASEDVLRAIGAEAQKHGILMSLHAPYFISLSSVEEEKRTNSINYITRSLRASELLGADTDSTGFVSEAGRCQLSEDAIAKMTEAFGKLKNGEIVPAANFNGLTPEDFTGLN